MVHWRGTGDRRPALVLDRRDLDDARLEADPTAADPVLVLVAGGATERLASARAADVVALLAPGRGGERSTMDGERMP
jgi:AmiR/NasT family two-component response regulator